MKLLQKKQLNENVNEQKKNDIKAGLFLAKKVDQLRENLQDTQKQHDDAISSMEQEFKVFTTNHLKEKGTLNKEIEGLRAVKKALQEPLDEAWSDFHRQNDELLVSQDTLLKTQYIASQKELELNKKQDEITKLLKETADTKEETNNLLQRTQNMLLAQQNEGVKFLEEKENWDRQKVTEEKDILRRNIEADNAKQEYESYLESVKQKERLLDLKLRKFK